MEEYIQLFKLYPEQFPRGYFKHLKSSLQEHINKNTLIYNNGVLITWKIYKNKTKKYKRGDVKLCHFINKQPGNNQATIAMNSFLQTYPNLKLEVRNNNIRALKFYKKCGFTKINDIFFGKLFPGQVMERIC